jgi:hypothetical protein
MEPASIIALVGTCISITHNATNFVSALNDGLTRVRELDLDATAVNTQAEVLALATARLRTWLDSNGRELQNQERETIRGSINACERLTRSLRDAAQSVIGRDRRPGLDFVRKAMFVVFSQPRLRRISDSLNDQINTLNLFLQILNL